MIPEQYIFFDSNAGGGDPPPKDPPPDQKQGEHKKKTEKDPDPVPYTRFKEVNDENQALRDQLKELQAADKKRQEEDLTKKEEWKTLADQRGEELEDALLKVARLEVAIEKSLPADLVPRLQGSTKEELLKDADSILATLTDLSKKTKPGIPPQKPGGGEKPFDIDNASPAEIRKARKDGKI